MKKMALIQLPHFYAGGLSREPELYPLGLGYINSVLKNKGVECQAIDLWRQQLHVDQAIEMIKHINADVFGISVYSTQYNYLKEFTKKLRRLFPNTPIICGGPGATFSSDIILKYTEADVCVISEGEETVIDLLDNFNDLKMVKGIVYKDENKNICKTEPRPLIIDLSTIPLSDREIFDLESYIRNAIKYSKGLAYYGLRNTNIISGRGCPYNCRFCSKTFAGFRPRPVDDIIAEISFLKHEYNIEYIRFNDELLLINKQRVSALCNEIKKLNIKWECQGRINLVDKEVLTLIKDAGCLAIGYGVEAISQSILNNMNKMIKTDSIIPVIEMTKKIGLKPLVQYMYGYPGENDETVAETENFFKKIDHLYNGSVTTPLPGTFLYQECLKNGKIKDEEHYLYHLDSGYATLENKINLTNFSDKEFFAKYKQLKKRIDTYYYTKHPIKAIQHYKDRIIYFAGLPIKKPRYFIRKLKMKIMEFRSK